MLIGGFVGTGVAISGIVGGWNPAPSLVIGLIAAFVAMNLLGTVSVIGLAARWNAQACRGPETSVSSPMWRPLPTI